MKSTEVQLPDPLFEKVEGIAKELHLSVPEVLRTAAEQLVLNQAQSLPSVGNWRFPEAMSLGAFLSPAEQWRLAANEDSGE